MDEDLLLAGAFFALVSRVTLVWALAAGALVVVVGLALRRALTTPHSWLPSAGWVGEAVALAPVRSRADADAYAVVLGGDFVSLHGWAPATVELHLAQLRNPLLRAKAGTGVALIRRGGIAGPVVGFISLNRSLSDGLPRWAMGIHVLVGQRGAGLGGAAVALMLERFGAEAPEGFRLEATTAADNLAMHKVLVGAGFGAGASLPWTLPDGTAVDALRFEWAPPGTQPPQRKPDAE